MDGLVCTYDVSETSEDDALSLVLNSCSTVVCTLFSLTIRCPRRVARDIGKIIKGILDTLKVSIFMKKMQLQLRLS